MIYSGNLFSGINDLMLGEIMTKPTTAHSDFNNKDCAFLVNIKFKHHSSWQGTVKWLDTGQCQNFRSALELIMLIESALQTGHSPSNTNNTATITIGWGKNHLSITG